VLHWDEGIREGLASNNLLIHYCFVQAATFIDGYLVSTDFPVLERSCRERSIPRGRSRKTQGYCGCPRFYPEGDRWRKNLSQRTAREDYFVKLLRHVVTKLQEGVSLICQTS